MTWLYKHAGLQRHLNIYIVNHPLYPMKNFSTSWANQPLVKLNSNISPILFYSSAVKVVISVSGNFHKKNNNGISWRGFFVILPNFCVTAICEQQGLILILHDSNIHVVYTQTGCTGELQPLDQLVLKTQTLKKDHAAAKGSHPSHNRELYYRSRSLKLEFRRTINNLQFHMYLVHH